jgi:hypothetical protein
MADCRTPRRRLIGHLAKVGVEGSNPFARSESLTQRMALSSASRGTVAAVLIASPAGSDDRVGGTDDRWHEAAAPGRSHAVGRHTGEPTARATSPDHRKRGTANEATKAARAAPRVCD